MPSLNVVSNESRTLVKLNGQESLRLFQYGTPEGSSSHPICITILDSSSPFPAPCMFRAKPRIGVWYSGPWRTITRCVSGHGWIQYDGAELIRIGKEKGAKKFVLDAQVQAIGFYQKLGFAVKSDVFIEAGIEHVRMEAVFE